MEGADPENVRRMAREKYPDVRPRIISANGPEFFAKELKEFVRLLRDPASVEQSALYKKRS
jgi:hypothetical protein